MGETSPGGAHAWLSSTELSALKACLQVTLDRLSRRLYLPICVYIFTHSYTHVTINLKKKEATNLNKERYMGGFEGEKGGRK